MTQQTQRTVTLVKGRHTYVFRYCRGQEAALVTALTSLARDPRWDFTWLDAALLSYQMELQDPTPAQPVGVTDPRDTGYGRNSQR